MQKAPMAQVKNVQSKANSVCTQHEWKPLFAAPANAEAENNYLSRGHSDYVECTRCRAIAMREKSSSEKMLTLSQTFSEQKRREATVWNQENEFPGFNRLTAKWRNSADS